ncbi:MAG: sugar ABC transporter ATP-binding protein [Clostridiales Family XIII bacterium]|nr:sugar ABC transporter ATP-binding protein [Clostridiales Family XIII bacterium]
MESIIRFEKITKRFSGVQALDDVSFAIEKAQVHAIVGENGAGKSTLMNILSGLLVQDEGQVYYKGEARKIGSPAVARKLGIATVFQELKNCDNLTVTENIFMGREIKSGFSPNWRKMNELARGILREYGVEIDVQTPLSGLSMAQKQIIEIAKAIDLNADVLILDEPTSALTVNETRHLFANIRRLKEKQVTVIFISHRLEEIFEIADVVSVLRNGKYLCTCETGSMTTGEVIQLIAGKDLVAQYAATGGKSGRAFSKKVLEVEHLSRGSAVRDVSFALYEGEILGFYGLQGSGRTETMEAVFGLAKKTGGAIRMFDEDVRKPDTRASIRGRMSMLTEERKYNGVFFNMDVNENIAVVHSRKIARGGFLNSRRMREMANAYVDRLAIKCTGLKQPIGKLSGGNQQKVILSRGLSTDPSILILDEPTRGVDVGAKAEIYEILRALQREKNLSMIVISSELPEIILLCDRILVMHGGRITGELTGGDINEEAILKCAFNDSLPPKTKGPSDLSPGSR